MNIYFSKQSKQLVQKSDTPVLSWR